jgi:hypothetical protein
MNLGYIDPGSGSMILQVLLGGIAAAAVALKVFWRRVLEFLHLSKPSEPEPSAVDADAPAAASEPAGKH